MPGIEELLGAGGIGSQAGLPPSGPSAGPTAGVGGPAGAPQISPEEAAAVQLVASNPALIQLVMSIVGGPDAGSAIAAPSDPAAMLFGGAGGGQGGGPI
jgi:hypothetical protein